MSEVRIFVESHKDKPSADENFLKGLISELIPVNDEIRYIGLGGKDIDKFEKSISSFITNSEDGINLIIIDADQNDLNARRTEILNFLREKNVTAEIFFFPNNNDPGELETLIQRIILPAKLSYFECLIDFENCIVETAQSPPSLKDKLHIYCCSFLNASERDQRGQLVYPSGDYFKARFFDLNSPHLDRLKDFLRHHLV